jgi:crotonobetainyl-CoA:carnitine CoA-transferase CaiB-like acyl-CoA transferase
VLVNDLMPMLEHPILGEIRMPACPINMSDSTAGTRRPPPALGADGPDVLRELGYDDARIDALLAEGVVFTRERLLERDGEG